MITCEPSTSVIVAPARSAIERTTSAPAALSPVATTAHDGRCFHAGGPVGSENATSATGRWVAAISAACLVGEVAGERVAGLRRVDRRTPSPTRRPRSGTGAGTSALFRTLSFEPASTSPSVSPSSGAKAAT